MKKVKLINYDSWGFRYCFYLDGKEDLGDFIKIEKPCQINYNNIPIKKWFIYENHESGDYDFGEIILASDYIEGSFEQIINISKEISQLRDIMSDSQ